MIIRPSIDKSRVAQLPQASFPGRIYLIQSEAEAEKAVAYLLTQGVVGIDSETKPSFKKGQTHKVALLQVATQTQCFLFRLNNLGLPPALLSLLTSPKLIKVGLSLKDDLMMLRKRAPFQDKGCIDLQHIVSHFGIAEKSLQKIYAILFGERISKSQQLSNWEADVLTDGQQQYAALDAWACLRIYQLLETLRQQGSYQVVPEEPAKS